MKHIKDKYFRNELKSETLSKDEYKYYYDHLVVTNTDIFSTKVIYFDNQKFIIIGGECLKEFNRLNGLIKNTFSLNTFRIISIGDNVIATLKSLFPYSSIIFTNLVTEAILSRKISLQCEYDLLSLSTIISIDKTYQDLIGAIENQGLKSFFPTEKIKKPFQEAIANIDSQKVQVFPSELLALIHWFKQCNIN